MTYQYDASLATSPRESIEDYGSKLLEAVFKARKEDELRPLIFVAHDFGGIIIKCVSIGILFISSHMLY